MVAFNDYRLVAFRNNFVVPDCFHYGTSPDYLTLPDIGSNFPTISRNTGRKNRGSNPQSFTRLSEVFA